MWKLNDFMDMVVERNPGQPEFHQAVKEFAEKVIPYVNTRQDYLNANIMERIIEPDRIISFRVSWMNDQNKVEVHRGYRVQFNGALGPYKGGLRFDNSVTVGTLKFLAFEQTFKNSLTTLPMGGGKGGSNFNPKGKSDAEVMRFCQAFMTELARHIGKDMDVPAGDIGVGAREIGYLFGQYRRISNTYAGAITGKGIHYGGSHLRPEATGYGTVYMAREMLAAIDETLEGKTCAISGSGNVAQFTAEKLLQLGAKVVTMSDRGGFIHDENGIDEEKLTYLKDLKNVRRGSLSEYAKTYNCEYYSGKRPWNVTCDAAFPCATQNELDVDDAKALVENGCKLVAEGANMPTTAEGVEVFERARTLFTPGKAANAGGVAVSGLEMTQNSLRYQWEPYKVDERLQWIMRSIHEQCVKYGRVDDHYVDYVKGANIGGFVKVADAMVSYGVM